MTQPKPKDKEKCDKCGGKLIQRKDDAPEAIKKRIGDYHKETFPILENYKEKLITVNGEKNIEEVTKEILKKIN